MTTSLELLYNIDMESSSELPWAAGIYDANGGKIYYTRAGYPHITMTFRDKAMATHFNNVTNNLGHVYVHKTGQVQYKCNGVENVATLIALLTPYLTATWTQLNSRKALSGDEVIVVRKIESALPPVTREEIEALIVNPDDLAN